mmetsp:Transcript_35452/g.41052  ORF Transcript_35452/g.41052 Transcript_35452/m.41052 type:complete len:86 (-) Transcript_35452:14-271(-)
MNQRREQQDEKRLSDSTRSMMKSSEEIPVIARYLIPTVIFGNIGLFISGHLSLGASLLIYFQVAGEELIVDNFYIFSLRGIKWDA